MLNEFTTVKLLQAFLRLLPEPMIVIKISLYDFRNQLLRATSACRCSLVQLGFELRAKVDFHGIKCNSREVES